MSSPKQYVQRDILEKPVHAEVSEILEGNHILSPVFYLLEKLEPVESWIRGLFKSKNTSNAKNSSFDPDEMVEKMAETIIEAVRSAPNAVQNTKDAIKNTSTMLVNNIRNMYQNHTSHFNSYEKKLMTESLIASFFMELINPSFVLSVLLFKKIEDAKGHLSLLNRRQFGSQSSMTIARSIQALTLLQQIMAVSGSPTENSTEPLIYVPIASNCSTKTQDFLCSKYPPRSGYSEFTVLRNGTLILRVLLYAVDFILLKDGPEYFPPYCSDAVANSCDEVHVKDQIENIYDNMPNSKFRALLSKSPKELANKCERNDLFWGKYCAARISIYGFNDEGCRIFFGNATDPKYKNHFSESLAKAEEAILEGSVWDNPGVYIALFFGSLAIIIPSYFLISCIKEHREQKLREDRIKAIKETSEKIWNTLSSERHKDEDAKTRADAVADGEEVPKIVRKRIKEHWIPSWRSEEMALQEPLLNSDTFREMICIVHALLQKDFRWIGEKSRSFGLLSRNSGLMSKPQVIKIKLPAGALKTILSCLFKERAAFDFIVNYIHYAFHPNGKSRTVIKELEKPAQIAEPATKPESASTSVEVDSKYREALFDRGNRKNRVDEEHSNVSDHLDMPIIKSDPPSVHLTEVHLEMPIIKIPHPPSEEALQPDSGMGLGFTPGYQAHRSSANTNAASQSALLSEISLQPSVSANI